MRKTYHAKSELCINVRVDNGYRHVAFIPHTMGGSSLSTDDPELQSAIEQHRMFGAYITMEEVREEVNKGGQSPSSDSGDTQKPQELTFTSITDAKDYIANRWGYSRTMIRYREQVDQIASEHGVVIKLLSG